MNDVELRLLLEEGLCVAAENLVARIKAKEFSAADVNVLRQMARDAGISLSFSGKPTPVGEAVLVSLADVDPELLN